MNHPPAVARRSNRASTLHREHPRGRPGRHLHARLLRHRPALLSAGYLAALLAVVGIDDAKDAATALEPLAGGSASTLFGAGFLGAALLAAAIVPLSTAYSVAEAADKPADINCSFGEARLFYLSYGAVVVVAGALVLIPDAPLIEILFLSQALNAVLLLVMLPFVRRLAADRDLMGDEALGIGGRVATGIALALIAVSVIALGVLALIG
jgi:Mn2+/Fe2+ NRAMP family transporter